MPASQELWLILKPPIVGALAIESYIYQNVPTLGTAWHILFFRILLRVLTSTMADTLSCMQCFPIQPYEKPEQWTIEHCLTRDLQHRVCKRL